MPESPMDRALRVRAGLREIRQSYDTLSCFHGVIERCFEKEVRRRSLEILHIQPGERVLEIGTGTGVALAEMARAVGPGGKVYGLDLSPGMLRRTAARLRNLGLNERAELITGDARGLPYTDAQFDAVYMAATLEQFDTPDIPRVLFEVKRVLKSGGRLGVASLSRRGVEGSRFVRAYEWLHRRFPRYATCRPIYVAEVIGESGLDITTVEELTIMNVAPVCIVVAAKGS